MLFANSLLISDYKVRIALDATCLSDRPSGARQRFVGIYRNLIRDLPEVQFVVFEPKGLDVVGCLGPAANLKARQTPFSFDGKFRRFLTNRLSWSGLSKGEEFDLLEGFHLPLSGLKAKHRMLTIHDIRRLTMDWNLIGRWSFAVALGHAVRRVDALVVVSDFMKSELMPYAGGLPIYSIPNGIDESSFVCPSPLALSDFRRKFDVPSKFILAVGHFEARKNYLNLIDALLSLRADLEDLHLVIIGNDNGYRTLIESHIAKKGLKNRVALLSGLNDQDVRCAYKLSTLFIFPSYYEGFGIPIIEAMAMGKPMALSDLPVFRELTQNRGVYFSPNNSFEMAKAIRQVLSSRQLQEEQINFGRRRACDFQYRKISAQYKKLYQNLLGLP